MAEYGAQEVLSFTADVDLTACRYHAVRYTVGGSLCNVNLAVDPTASSVAGLLVNNPKQGEFASVALFGRAKVVAGAAITAGAIISTNASGRAITIVSGAAVLGRALETATADGQIISAFLGAPSVGSRHGGAP